MNENINKIIPRAHTFISEAVVNKNNPLGIAESRSLWAKDINFDQNAEYTFFAGCGYQTMKYSIEMINAAKKMRKLGISTNATLGISSFISKSSFDITGMTAKFLSHGKEDLYGGILVKAVSVLKKLGVKIDYLGDDEPCCGSPLYYSGYFSNFNKNRDRALAVFKSKAKKNIIGLIPACTNTLRNYFRRKNEKADFEVKHFVEIVAEKIIEKDLAMSIGEKLTVAYHDPCQLSRYLKIIDEPRYILSRIKGIKMAREDRNHSGEWSSCCGGGGGLEVVSPDLSERIAINRVKQLCEDQPDAIITCCPFCLMQLKNGVERLKLKTKVFDIVEIIDSAL